jgi:K+-transporting ATPase KdpF subunit
MACREAWSATNTSVPTGYVEPIMEAANIAGLILAIALLIFLIIALTYPDRFRPGADRRLPLGHVTDTPSDSSTAVRRGER